VGNSTGWNKLSENQSVSDYIFAPTPAASEVKSIQPVKVVASSKLLPKTGTPYDFNFYVGLGFTLIATGVVILVSQSSHRT
jgi:hypothetical protein